MPIADAEGRADPDVFAVWRRTTGRRAHPPDFRYLDGPPVEAEDAGDTAQRGSAVCDERLRGLVESFVHQHIEQGTEESPRQVSAVDEIGGGAAVSPVHLSLIH